MGMTFKGNYSKRSIGPCKMFTYDRFYILITNPSRVEIKL